MLAQQVRGALREAPEGAYSYYESVENKRLTDQAWRIQLKAGPRPEQPAWLAELGGPPIKRKLTLK